MLEGIRASKKTIYFSLALCVVLVAALLWLIKKPQEINYQSTGQVIAPSVNKIRRLLDGVAVNSEAEKNHLVLAAMVDNAPEARPTVGMGQANLLYELPVEGGRTRFMALFDSANQVTQIGPIRSVRPYCLDLAGEYGAVVVHSGGSEQALAEIASDKFNSLNEFYFGKYYWRDSLRIAPHNLFTSITRLRDAWFGKNIADQASFTSWQYKDDGPVTPSPIKTITVQFSSDHSTSVVWQYQISDNTYLRQQELSEKIAAKNILLVYVKAEELKDDLKHISLNLAGGTGRLVAFLDGRVVEGKWQKDSRFARTRLMNSDGSDLTLNAGFRDYSFLGSGCLAVKFSILIAIIRWRPLKSLIILLSELAKIFLANFFIAAAWLGSISKKITPQIFSWAICCNKR